MRRCVYASRRTSRNIPRRAPGSHRTAVHRIDLAERPAGNQCCDLAHAEHLELLDFLDLGETAIGRSLHRHAATDWRRESSGPPILPEIFATGHAALFKTSCGLGIKTSSPSCLRRPSHQSQTKRGRPRSERMNRIGFRTNWLASSHQRLMSVDVPMNPVSALAAISLQKPEIGTEEEHSHVIETESYVWSVLSGPE